MGLLDQLWDDTLAGPMPDNGLGKLRKHSTFTFRPNYSKELEVETSCSVGEEATDDVMRVTRSIMIVRPSSRKESPPVSPAGSTPPVSPFSGGGEASRFRRRSGSFAYEKASRTGPKNPSPPYDQ